MLASPGSELSRVGAGGAVREVWGCAQTLPFAILPLSSFKGPSRRLFLSQEIPGPSVSSESPDPCPKADPTVPRSQGGGQQAWIGYRGACQGGTPGTAGCGGVWGMEATRGRAGEQSRRDGEAGGGGGHGTRT